MKNLLLFCLLLIAFAGRAQTIPPVDPARGKITYSDVIQAPGVSQPELYGRALRWLATVVPHTTADPSVKDPASGTLVTRVGLPFTARAGVGSMQATLWREISVTVKDGKAKYEISNFEMQPYVANAAVTTPPSKAQLKLTPAEEYLNRTNGTYYSKSGEPKAWVTSIFGAIDEQTATQVASLRAALAKSNDF